MWQASPGGTQHKREVLAAALGGVSAYLPALPPDQAAPVWQAALTEAAAMAHGQL